MGEGAGGRGCRAMGAGAGGRGCLWERGQGERMSEGVIKWGQMRLCQSLSYSRLRARSFAARNRAIRSSGVAGSSAGFSR